MEEQAAAEKEKRIKHITEMAARRIGKQDLTRGWLGWVEPYREEKRIQNMLKAAGARLAKPKVVASFSKWKDDWNVEELERTRKELEQKAWASMSDAEKAQAEVHAKEELEYLGVKLTRRVWSTRLLHPLPREGGAGIGSKLEAEREKRIEHTQQMAIKRIIKRDLARGWVGWLENYLTSGGARIC